MRSRNVIGIGVAAAVVALVAACAQGPESVVSGGAAVRTETRAGAVPTSAPRRVYVQDFRLDAQTSEQRGGVLGRPRILQEMVEGDPQAQAQKIVDRMAESLVRDLVAAGVPAERLRAGAPLPAEGWLVRGVFTETAGGEAPRRAIIGFGAGASEMQVQVGVNDLANNPEQSFAVFGTITDPSRLPGGVVTRNPYVVAAKFVVAQGAPTRDIDHTAKAIADELVKFRDEARRGAVTVPVR